VSVNKERVLRLAEELRLREEQEKTAREEAHKRYSIR
jgi:hypothetical protein